MRALFATLLCLLTLTTADAASRRLLLQNRAAASGTVPIESLPGAQIVYDMASVSAGNRVTNKVNASNFTLIMGGGLGSDADDPAVVTEGLQFAANGGNAQYATNGGSVFLTNFSIYAVVNRAGAGVGDTYGAILVENHSYENVFAFHANYNFPCPMIGFNTAQLWADTLNLRDSTWHCLAATYNGSLLKMFLDGVEVASRSASVGFLEITNMMLSEQYRGFVGKMAYAAVFNVAHSAAEVVTMRGRFATEIAGRGITLSAPSKFIVFEGDSLTDPQVSPVLDEKYSYRSCTNQSPFLWGRNLAINGSDIADLEARAATVDSFYDASRGTNNILSVFIGANDVVASGDTNQIFADLKSYCEDRRAVGWKIVLGTILPNDFAAQVRRNTINAMIRNDPSFYDALADFAANTTIGEDGDEDNLTYYSDGVHLTAAGQGILVPIHAAALDSILGP